MTELHRAFRRAVLLLALAPGSAFAQTAKVRVAENLRSSPNGEVIGQLDQGLPLKRVSSQGDWLEVEIDGWVWLRSLQTTKIGGHDLVVSEAGGENLRERPSGAILGKFPRGTLFDERERMPGWVRVRRVGWIWAASVDTAKSPAPPPQTRTGAGRPSGSAAPPSAAPSNPPANASANRATAAAGPSAPPANLPAAASRSGTAAASPPAAAPTNSSVRSVPATSPPPAPGPRGAGLNGPAILAGPGGDTLARVRPGAQVQVLARQGSWARVRVEGWAWLPSVDSVLDLSPVDATPAQLAAQPDRFRGRVVSWDLQFLSLEKAERIRTEFFEGEPFLLTRHTAGGYVYVAVSPDQLAGVSNLLPLERIHVVGRVRAPASALTGSAILDLMELSRTRDRR